MIKYPGEVGGLFGGVHHRGINVCLFRDFRLSGL